MTKASEISSPQTLKIHLLTLFRKAFRDCLRLYASRAVYFIAVLALVVSMLVLSYLLGQRHTESATGEPYESGIVSTGSSRLRFSVKFYRVAMLFVIFDLEVAFVIAWAIAFRELGWAGYLGVLFFIGVLVAALIYEWRLGALDWGPMGQERIK